MKNLDRILLEYFTKREDGGANFNSKSYDDLQHFETFLIECGYIHSFDRAKLNELFGSSTLSKTISTGVGKVTSKLKSFWRKILDIVKSGYSQIVRRFHSECGRIESDIKNYDLGEEILIPLPRVTEPNLSEFSDAVNNVTSLQSGVAPEGEAEIGEAKEGATAFKGYYNEYLTCEYILAMDSGKLNEDFSLLHGVSPDPTVRLTDPNRTTTQFIRSKSREYYQKLKEVCGDEFDDTNRVVNLGSKQMADYLIDAAKKSGAFIYDIQAVGEDKEGVADILVKMTRTEGDFSNAYSLKISEGKNINLANRTFGTQVEQLCGNAQVKEELKKRLMSDPEYKKAFDQGKILNAELQAQKRAKNTSKLADLRKGRGLARQKLNLIAAKVLYGFLKDFNDKNKLAFSQNLQKLLGFSDKDIGILTAIVKKSKKEGGYMSELLAKKPEFDFSNLKVTYDNGVSIKIINEKAKQVIVTISLKEGVAAANWVDFSSVTPFDQGFVPFEV
jgi:hypothetical protein